MLHLFKDKKDKRESRVLATTNIGVVKLNVNFKFEHM